MAQISRSTKVGGGTVLQANTLARAADVETDVLTLFNAHNNHDSGTSSWTVVKAEGSSSVPLISNNSTGTQNIFEAKDNGTTVVSVADGGAVAIAAAANTVVPLTVTSANGGSAKTAIINNGTSTGNILEVQDNGTAAVTVADGGSVTFTGVLLPALGAVGAPAYSFTGDTNTGVYSSAADTVNISAGNSSIAQFDSAGITLGTNKPVIPGAVSGTPAAHALYRDNVVKGWINFNGTGTIATNTSFNVTSITDNGTGDYTVTWDRDFTAIHTVVGSASNANYINIVGVNLGSTQINTVTDAAAAEDTTTVCLVVLGAQ